MRKRAETEGNECWKKKERTGGCGAPQGNLYLKKPKKKRFLQIFRKVSGVFQQNFNGSKIVLSSSRGQGNFRGLEASRPRPKTSKCVLEAKDVLKDFTSVKNQKSAPAEEWMTEHAITIGGNYIPLHTIGTCNYHAITIAS